MLHDESILYPQNNRERRKPYIDCIVLTFVAPTLLRSDLPGNYLSSRIAPESTPRDQWSPMICSSGSLTKYSFYQQQVFPFIDSLGFCGLYWIHFIWEVIFIPCTWSSFDCFSSELRPITKLLQSLQCFLYYMMSEMGHLTAFLSYLIQNMQELPPHSYFLL